MTTNLDSNLDSKLVALPISIPPLDAPSNYLTITKDSNALTLNSSTSNPDSYW